jgi:hypothetical protein
MSNFDGIGIKPERQAIFIIYSHPEDEAIAKITYP